MKTAVCCIAKMENDYIREWVDYYLKLGFSNVIIYDNNDYNGECFDDVISDYIKSGFVLIRNCRGIRGFHQTAYQKCYDEFSKIYDWIAFFDVDEFLELDSTKYANINAFLSDPIFDSADIIRVSWKHFDDNDLLVIENNNYNVRDRFTRIADINYIENSWTKGIVRCNLEHITVSQEQDGAHMIKIPEINIAVNCCGKIVNNNTLKNGRCWENAWLCHYRFRTIEEYVLKKRARGWSVHGFSDDFTDKLFNLDNFFRINKKTLEKVNLFNEMIEKMSNNKTRKKRLILYWYIPTFFWHEIYNLHILNLKKYCSLFDNITCVLSIDDVKNDDYLNKMKDIINDVFKNKIVDYVTYKNDEELRESKYFYNEIAEKLDSFGDDILFFAHNKGVQSFYVTRQDLNDWINIMYEHCLSLKNVNEFCNNNNSYFMGSIKVIYKPQHFSWQKYGWHYSGTFFWLKPREINNYLINNNIVLPENNRYFAEGFLGHLFPIDSTNQLTVLPLKNTNERITEFKKRIS